MQIATKKKLAPIGVWHLPAKKLNLSSTSNQVRHAESSKSESTPQLVLNPFSQRFINIQPLLKYLNEKRRDSPAQLAESTKAAIRFVSLNFDSEGTDSLELKNTLAFLFEMKDVFGKLEEYKSA